MEELKLKQKIRAAILLGSYLILVLFAVFHHHPHNSNAVNVVSNSESLNYSGHNNFAPCPVCLLLNSGFAKPDSYKTVSGLEGETEFLQYFNPGDISSSHKFSTFLRGPPDNS
ncbi:MAG: hypothetical protein K9I71_02980 [Ignavibacteriales bacterium]|nr:hypothetical protein [Ignavibacteriales bacterium]MCF8435948.1 hypothetical protein [Ignavibacteriales bacterium]